VIRWPRHPGIVATPAVRWGEPRIENTGVSCASLFGRFMGGESMAAIISDNGGAPEVEEAIRFEVARRLRWASAQEIR
jgi:uncharacterized protein (DUF433 family)